MPDLSVIIVNYNSRAHLDYFIPSLKQQTYRSFELVIADNASSDDSLSVLAKAFPAARIIMNTENLGYTKAMNQGIRNSGGKYVLTLNFDLILEPDFIKEMLKAADRDPGIGSVSGKLYRYVDGKKTGLIDSTGHIMQRDRIVKNREKNVSDPGYIFGVSGAASLYRREMLEDIKYMEEYLDEDLVAGYDDVDVDWRAQNRGWKCYYTPLAVAYHARGGANQKSSRRWRFLNYRNRYLVMLKNDNLGAFILDLPFILLCELGLFFSMLLDLQLVPVWLSVLSLLPKFRAKRVRSRT